MRAPWKGKPQQVLVGGWVVDIGEDAGIVNVKEFGFGAMRADYRVRRRRPGIGGRN